MRHSLIRSGVVSLGLLLALAACRFPYGFSGGGLPPNIRTIAVLPLENNTATAELTAELSEVLSKELRGKFGLKEAGEARADLVVRGSIERYEADMPVGYSANPASSPGSRRRLSVGVNITITVQQTGRQILTRSALTGQGDYAEGAEAAGRKAAFEDLIGKIVEDIQNQW